MQTYRACSIITTVMWRIYVLCMFAMIVEVSQARTDLKNDPRNNDDLALWIDEKQVKILSGLAMEIYVILGGNVQPYIRDPNLETYLPIIPSEVGYVNFTWKAGLKKYSYDFDLLESNDESILQPPEISIRRKGRIPRRPKEFSIHLPCSGNNSGTATFGLRLLIHTGKGRPLLGTPLRLRLRKECAPRSPDPECNRKCANQGWCNIERICQCPEGYMGQYCRTALCYPQCTNGGNCTSPGVCSCPAGFQGRHCEGGICAEKCLNGGKCIQKDSCQCSKGFYGPRCEYSKCIIPCLNGGRCRGVNKCKCPMGFGGDHCEIGRVVMKQASSPHSILSASYNDNENGHRSHRTGGQQSGKRVSTGGGSCSRYMPSCKHGRCVDDICQCDDGWYGRLCHHKIT